MKDDLVFHGLLGSVVGGLIGYSADKPWVGLGIGAAAGAAVGWAFSKKDPVAEQAAAMGVPDDDSDLDEAGEIEDAFDEDDDETGRIRFPHINFREGLQNFSALEGDFTRARESGARLFGGGGGDDDEGGEGEVADASGAVLRGAKAARAVLLTKQHVRKHIVPHSSFHGQGFSAVLVAQGGVPRLRDAAAAASDAGGVRASLKRVGDKMAVIFYNPKKVHKDVVMRNVMEHYTRVQDPVLAHTAQPSSASPFTRKPGKGAGLQLPKLPGILAGRRKAAAAEGDDDGGRGQGQGQGRRLPPRAKLHHKRQA